MVEARSIGICSYQSWPAGGDIYIITHDILGSGCSHEKKVLGSSRGHPIWSLHVSVPVRSSLMTAEDNDSARSSVGGFCVHFLSWSGHSQGAACARDGPRPLVKYLSSLWANMSKPAWKVKRTKRGRRLEQLAEWQNMWLNATFCLSHETVA